MNKRRAPYAGRLPAGRLPVPPLAPPLPKGGITAMALLIKGETGQVKVGYQLAATLGPWQMTYGRNAESPEGERVQTWEMKTTARDVNVVWLSRGVYDLVLPFGQTKDGAQQYAKFKSVRIDWPDCQCEFTIRGEGRPEFS